MTKRATVPDNREGRREIQPSVDIGHVCTLHQMLGTTTTESHYKVAMKVHCCDSVMFVNVVCYTDILIIIWLNYVFQCGLLYEHTDHHMDR